MPSHYQLKADVLLYDTLTLNPARTLSQANLTNQLAIYHLATNPPCQAYFSHLAPTWQADVQAYLQAQQPSKPTAKAKRKQHQPQANQATPATPNASEDTRQ